MVVLAMSFQNREQYWESEPFFVQLVDIHTRQSGPSHDVTLTMKGGLARAIGGQGRHDDAARLYQEAIDGLRARGEGERHNTLELMSFYAGTLEALGRAQEAEETLLRLLEIRERLLRPEHARSRRTRYTLGKFYLRHRRPEDARTMFEHVFTGRADAITSLADAHEMLDEKDKASELRLAVMRRLRQAADAGLERRPRGPRRADGRPARVGRTGAARRAW